MNADQSSPPAPTSVPTALSPAGPSLPVVPHPHHPPKGDQSPVLVWLLAAWDKLKAGQVGNPKWIALAVGIGLVGFGWWYFARSSKKADSALWYQFDTSLSPESLKTFVELPVNADTDAARLGRRNLAKDKLAVALRGLNDPAARRADKLKAVKAIEEARDELAKLADEFKRDRTSKAGSLLDAAEAEKALIGVPKDGAGDVMLNAKANGRGQVERVAELTRKAAEAIGDKTDAGQKLLAEADRLTKEADDIYKVGGYLHAAFNEADPEERKPILPPLGGDTPPPPAGTDEPKAPDKLPDPVNPAKPADAKPDDKPKEPAPLPPANPPEKK
jgi:hypothetical protein